MHRPRDLRLSAIPRPVLAVLLLGPIVTVLALRLPLVNQLEFADAWFYSGYAWTPKHHFDVYGWNYFAVRFPPILSIGVFDKVFGAQLGYVVLRYLLAVASAAAIYALVRRFASMPVALGAVVLLFVNAFWTRMLLWDYTSFVVVSAGVAGLALWFWADGRPARWTIPAGVALSLAVFANAIMGLALFVLFVVEAVAAVRCRDGAVALLARRTLVGLGCGAATFVVGYLGYLVVIGGLGPDDLLRPTVDFLSNNEENSAQYQLPVSAWIDNEPRLWAPLLLGVATAAALGREILSTTIRARIAQCLLGFTALLWLYRFGVTSSVLETWWAFNVVAIFMAPAAGVLLSALAEEATDARRRVGWLVGGAVATALAIRLGEGAALDAYDWMTGDGASFLVLGAGLVLAAVVAARRRAAVGLAAAVGALVLVQVFLYAPTTLDARGETGIFSDDASLEWDAYAAAKEVAELIRDNERPGEEILLWYPGNDPITQVAWIDLIHYGQTLNVVGVPEPVSKVTPLGVARLQAPAVTHVLVLTPQASQIATARRALARAGTEGERVAAGVLADGELHYDLVRVTRKPGEGADAR